MSVTLARLTKSEVQTAICSLIAYITVLLKKDFYISLFTLTSCLSTVKQYERDFNNII